MATKKAAAGGPAQASAGAEAARLNEDAHRGANWKRWGPYLSERQWGTVREDYSAGRRRAGTTSRHDQARSRAYRWGEDGLLGITDRECRLCFALCMWNGNDPILKERLFGLTGPEGNHGEDVQGELLLPRLDADALVHEGALQVPAGEFPYAQLVEENRRRNKTQPGVRARRHRRVRRAAATSTSSPSTPRRARTTS